jgi:transposase InsO family protein
MLLSGRQGTNGAGNEDPLGSELCPDSAQPCLISGITCLWTDKGWLYLASALDLLNREVIGWSL